MMEITKEEILRALERVVEPDLKKDIVALDLVSDVVVEGEIVAFEVKVSNPAMHGKKRMEEACLFALERHFGKKVPADIKVVGIAKEGTAEQRRILPGVKNIIAIASGKGGVGKSTITANLAVALARKGYRVGLVDADIYGPSMPIMFNVQTEKPKPLELDGKRYISPVESYGVKLLSIGFFASEDQAVVWRGPMASKALKQLFTDAWWGELDYMLVDLPPGTGDIHLTLVQSIPLSGAVIVSTPQKVALADARKGVAMFRMPSINVPVLGIVENMSWFTPEELPDNKYYIFGKDGAKLLAEQQNVKLLGSIPLIQSIREAGDVGRPAVMQEDTAAGIAFSALADAFVQQVPVEQVKAVS